MGRNTTVGGKWSPWTVPSTALDVGTFVRPFKIGYCAARVTSQIAHFRLGIVMSDATLPDTYVMLCDWRGHCVWVSSDEGMVRVGELAWKHLTTASQEDAKRVLGRVVSLREREQLEVVNRRRRRFRCWLFPLDSPEVAVCVLGVLVPNNLNKLSNREREILELLGGGAETRVIAQQLDVSLSTVHTHLRRARKKLGLSSVESLIAFAARHCYPTNRPLDKPHPTSVRRA